MSAFTKKYLAWIGPYPYKPWLIFIFFTSFYFSRFAPAINQTAEGGERWFAGLIILTMAALPSALFATLAFIVQKFRKWPSNLGTYVAEVALGQAILLLFSPLIGDVLRSRLGLEFSAAVTLTPSLFLAALILVLGLLGIMHHGERVILERLRLADQLVSKLELDREGLVRADEKLRDQTSKFLHDRVQSDLMVAGITLKTVAGKSNPEVNEVIDQVIARLEQTRTSDLRDLVEVLAPNFEASGFRDSVLVLVEPYRATMDIEVQVDEESEQLPNETLIGCYRIIEQSVLNALVHGPARNVRITLTTDSSKNSELEISDDGPGSGSGADSAGVGTAVIDSWVSIMQATKTIETVAGHGYLLRVNINKGA